MLPTQRGSVRLFRLFGVEVYVHWLWFVVAVWRITTHDERYSSIVWNAIEYLCLFLIVLMHEFGHALACRSVGGQANQIILWLLGGVAYVAPPQRPGAMLWSIAAGPLVNVVLLPIFGGIWLLGRTLGWPEAMPNLYMLASSLCFIDIVLLCFNLLPIYPLDGGQILQSLLWFAFGQARSLMIVSVVGIVGVVGLFIFAFMVHSYSSWSLIMAAFVLMSCWRGLTRARAMARLAQVPRHAGFACPECGESPQQGAFWRCSQCKTVFDTFETNATCPQCGTQFPNTTCLNCRAMKLFAEWIKHPAPPSGG